jgi:putative iron-regulated protein
MRRRIATALVLTLLGTAACSNDDKGASAATSTTAPKVALSHADALAAATTYADMAFASYTDVTAKAVALQTALKAFVAQPTAASLQAAKQAWLDARPGYGQTEVYRFYDGPIDNPKDGPEGLLNAWPLDESYIDYVKDDPTAGIIADTDGVPEITDHVLVQDNERGGETNISTGWHAIEFLLWGQDLSATGPGERPYTDYTTAPNAARRGVYLSLLGDLLVQDMTQVTKAWDPASGSYRTEFLAKPDAAVTHILRGMGALSAGELASERIAVAYDSKDQEDEHSCFSDNTTVDLAANARGIQMAYLADYPGITGTSLHDVLAKAEPALDKALVERLAQTTGMASALKAPFDQLILGADTAPGRVALKALIDGLQTQGDQIKAIGKAAGYTVSLST